MQARMGHPVQIASPKIDGGFQLDIGALADILLADDVKHKPAVLISVIGGLRTGKSFLLNLLLQHLSRSEDSDHRSFIASAREGFAWRKGSQRHTSGIWLWSKAFLVKRPQGDEVAVLLMDTQGLFGLDTTFEDSLSITVFCTLISSVMVYNVPGTIRQTDLLRLEQAVERGLKAQEKIGTEGPFQKLLFLVRDWSCEDAIPYGEKGGDEFLDLVLKSCPGQSSRMKKLQEHIWSYFSEIDCFLMPHPGLELPNVESNEVHPWELEEDFMSSVEELAHFLLAPDRLVEKRLCGIEVTCEALVSHIERCMGAANTQVQRPSSTVQVVAEADFTVVEKEAKHIYFDVMEKFCGVDDPAVPGSELIYIHNRLCNRILSKFRDRPKLGDHDLFQKNHEKLEQELEKWFDKVAELNEAKISSRSHWHRNTILLQTLAEALRAGVEALSAAFSPNDYNGSRKKFGSFNSDTPPTRPLALRLKKEL